MSKIITLSTLYHTIHVWQHWIFTAFDTVGDKNHFGRNQLTLFGRTFDEISKNGLFSDKLDLSDQMLKNVECLKKYVEGAKDSKNATKFLDECMQEADSTCKVFASQLDENIIATKNSARAIDQYTDSQTGMTKVTNTAINIGQKFVSVAGNMLTTLAISAVVNLAIQGITNLIERQEKLREAAIEAGSALDDEVSSINDYKSQISSLKESLDEGNLSEQEAYDVRKQLIGIQDQLVEKFGAEAAGIDLVNGKYEEQLGLLDSIANQKATEYLSEKNEAIINAQKRMTTQWSYRTGNEDDALSIMRTDVEAVKQLFGKYTDQGVSIDTAGLPQLTGLQDLNLKITADPTQAKNTIEQLYSDIEKDTTLRDDTKQALQNKLSEWKQSAQSIIDTDGSIAETAAKYQIQLSDSWSELYKNLEDAQSEYNEAVANSDDKAISEAVQKAKAARDALNDSTSFDLTNDKDKYVKQYMQAQADELESSTKLKAAQLGLQEVLKTGNTAYKESQQAIAKLTESEKQYGNVSNTNRDIIKWNAENMYKYRAAIKTHGWDVSAGDWSTAEGEYNEFGKGDNQIEIAYTPMLQTDSGLVPLTNREMTQYLDDIVGAATDKNGKIDIDKLFELDAKGLDMRVNSQMQHVNSMLAAAEGQIVDGVKLTGADVAAIAGSGAEELIERFGHTSDYVGKSMHDIQSDVLQYKTVAKDAFDDIDYSALTDYLDITKEDARDIVDTIKSSVQSLDGLNDLDLIDIGSLENAGTEITAYTKEQVQAYDNMKGAADKLGISMSDLIDILVKAGLVTGESVKYTNEFTTNALSAATNATKAISLVTAAMQSQSTTAGVSSDSYSELIKEQSEYAAALDFENGYVKLNTDMAKKITQAKIDEAEANIKLAYSQNQMKYSQVKADLEALNTAVQQNGELEGENAEQVEKARAELEEQSQQLRENCRNLQMQYSLLVQNSGAYQDWVNAQNASEAGDMYDSIIKAKQAIAEGLKNGKVGTEKFKAAVELTIPEDYQDDIAKYVKRLNRYFKQASDGSADASGLNNFITDSIKAGLMSKDTDNQIKIAADKTTKDFADALHLSMEDVQSIWGELQEYGWEFDWGSLLGNPIDNLRMQIDDIQDQMDALGDDAENSPVWQALNEQLTTLQDKLKETFSSADASEINQSIEDIVDEATKANGVLTESQTDTVRAMGRVQNLYDLAQAQEELTEKQKEYNDALNSQSSYKDDGSNLGKLTAELQQAQDKVTELTQNKEQLKDPTPLEISTFALDYAQGKIDGVKHTAEETTQMLSNIGVTVDTTQAQSDIDVQNQKAEQFTKTLSNVPVTLDTSTCQSKISTVSKAIDGLKREVPITLNFGVKGTIISAVSNGLSVFGKRSGRKNTGTNNAAGTPNSPGGKTLVGEVGNELVVNPRTGKWYTVGDKGAEFVNLPHGAIVFDHEKTKKLLNNGFVGGYGDALANGNAMDAGSPGVGSYVGTAGNNYLPGKNPLVKNTYKATTASTKATKDNSKALEENKKALEKQKTALEKQKTALEKESNKLKIYGQAALNEIEKRVKALNKEKEAQDKAFEAEIDHLNEIKDAKDKELDATTKRIKEEKDAKDKAWEKEKKQLEEKKEALQDANDEEDRAIKLAELKDALAKAQANRTVRIYNRNQGFIWAADQQAVNDAQTALDDQMRDWKREDVIKAVEDEIDAIDKLKDAYDEETENRLDDLDKEKDAFDEKIEAEIEEINKRKDAYDEAIEAEIEKLDDLKDQWNEVMSLIGTSWEDYQLGLEAAAHFSDMSFEGMTDDLIGYKDDVLANMEEIGGVTDQIDSITESIEKLEEAISDAKDAASGSSSGSGGDSAFGLGTADASDVDTDLFDELSASAQETIDKLTELQNKYVELGDGTESLNEKQLGLVDTMAGLTVGSAAHKQAVEELTDAQKQNSENTKQMDDIYTEYMDIVTKSTDLTLEQKQTLIDSMLETVDSYSSGYTTIDELMQAYADKVISNTDLTIEQRAAQLDNLTEFAGQYSSDYANIATVLEDSVIALAENTELTNAERQAQMDNISALADHYGVSKDTIVQHLVSVAAQEAVAKDSTEKTHSAMQNAVLAACQAMNASYDSTISKIGEMVQAYKQAQAEMMKADAEAAVKKDFAHTMPLGTVTNHADRIRWNTAIGVEGHATGVLNAATTHIAITDEKGPEIKMRKPSAGQYSLIEKGSSVIPAQPSANLWKFGLDPESFIASHMSQRSIKSVEITQPNTGNNPIVNVGDIQMYGVNDPDSFARVLHDKVGGIFAQEFSKR